MDAGNNLELPRLVELNGMEAARSSEQINVMVQIDRALGETAVSLYSFVIKATKNTVSGVSGIGCGKLAKPSPYSKIGSPSLNSPSPSPTTVHSRNQS